MADQSKSVTQILNYLVNQESLDKVLKANSYVRDDANKNAAAFQKVDAAAKTAGAGITSIGTAHMPNS